MLVLQWVLRRDGSDVIFLLCGQHHRRNIWHFICVWWPSLWIIPAQRKSTSDPGTQGTAKFGKYADEVLLWECHLELREEQADIEATSFRWSQLLHDAFCTKTCFHPICSQTLEHSMPIATCMSYGSFIDFSAWDWSLYSILLPRLLRMADECHDSDILSCVSSALQIIFVSPASYKSEYGGTLKTQSTMLANGQK